jgi:HEAT repeat protein
LDFFSASDPFIRFAAWVAAGAAFITAALVVQIVLLRELRELGEQRRQRFLQRWRPLAYQAMSGEAVRWPSLARRDAETFLWFWNQLHGTVRGDAKPALSEAGAQLGLAALALRRVASRRISRRLLGIVTLGNLQDPEHWWTLIRLTDDPHPPVSLAAAQALIRIDGKRAVTQLMPLFARRADWPVTRALWLLEQVDTAVVTQAIARAMPKSDDAAALRLVEFVAAADPVALQMAMIQRLRHSHDPQLYANVLRHVNDPDHFGLVRHCCTHKVWFVRVQAANALARAGAPEDVDRLIAMLTDPEWWVRYRAAEALLKLPFLKRDQLEERVRRAGPAAQEMLDRVAAKEAA